MALLQWTVSLVIVLLVLTEISSVSKPKVFVIGLNKTGTTSLGDALSILGYRRLGWEDIASRKLFHDWYSGDIRPLIRYSNHYEAFEDLPWPFVYQEMAGLYPDAKFILSLRATEEIWWMSISQHTARRAWMGHQLIYGSYSAMDSKEAYIDLYRRHQHQVHHFFRDQPSRLLELNIDQNATWTTLCDFLGCLSIPDVPFPKSNSKTSVMNTDHTGFFKTWDNLMNYIESYIASNWYYKGRPQYIPGKAIGLQ
jgi:hypothetical protein